MNKPLIHGENIFIPVTELPEGKRLKRKSYIAGHSESGHHHVVVSNVAFEVIEPANMPDEVFFSFTAPADVVHQKTHEIHETKNLKPGFYKRVVAQEYNPFTKVMQRQFD